MVTSRACCSHRAASGASAVGFACRVLAARDANDGTAKTGDAARIKTSESLFILLSGLPATRSSNHLRKGNRASLTQTRGGWGPAGGSPIAQTARVPFSSRRGNLLRFRNEEKSVLCFWSSRGELPVRPRCICANRHRIAGVQRANHTHGGTPRAGAPVHFLYSHQELHCDHQGSGRKRSSASARRIHRRPQGLSPIARLAQRPRYARPDLARARQTANFG